MRKPANKFSADKIILYVTGLIPVFWLGLRSAPFFQEKGLVGIKGHRSVGGFRASLYNALPKESVEALVDAMKEFERKN